MVTRENIISGGMAGDRLVRETGMIRRRLLEIPRNSTEIVEDVNDVAEEAKRRWARVVEKELAITTAIFS